MKHIINLSNCPKSAKGAVITLGNFDGVHKGHQQIINLVRRTAAGLGAPSGMLTFEPHPITILKSPTAISRLTPFEHKALLLEEHGLDYLFCQQFDEAFSQLSATEFIRTLLVKQLAIKHLIVGFDFIFGHKRSGNVTLLQELGKQHGFGVTALPHTTSAGEKCGSRAIRHLLQQGKLAEATSMLGTPPEYIGKVEKGEQRGRKLGFPTANISLDGYLMPHYGVYRIALNVIGGNEWVPGIANIGVKPTFGKNQPVLESHLFNVSVSLYGKTVRVRLLDFIRKEVKFTSLDALTTQITHDCERAKIMHRLG